MGRVQGNDHVHGFLRRDRLSDIDKVRMIISHIVADILVRCNVLELQDRFRDRDLCRGVVSSRVRHRSRGY